MAELLISDTADVIVKRKSDGRIFISAETQLASIATSLGIDEKIFGGIGNKPLAVIKGQKEVTSTLRNAFYDSEYLAMTQGVSVEEDGSASVYHREDALRVSDNAGELEVQITGTPIENTVYVRNEQGETVSAAITEKVVTVPIGHAKAGNVVSVTYKKDVVGDIVQLDAEKFAEAYEMEYRTIGYDRKTNKVVKDIYIQLDHVIPSGEFELSFENGSAIAPEISFDAMAAPNQTQIGRVIEVDRVATP